MFKNHIQQLYLIDQQLGRSNPKIGRLKVSDHFFITQVPPIYGPKLAPICNGISLILLAKKHFQKTCCKNESLEFIAPME